MRLRTDRALVIAASLFVLNCDSGPPDTQAACSAIAHAWCTRLWELSAAGCYDATGYIANYTDEQQCEGELEITFKQGTHTCADQGIDACSPMGYSASQASACVGGLQSFACDQDIAFVPWPSACRWICCAYAGAIVSTASACCSGSAHESATMSCGPSWGSPVEYICD